MAFKVTIRAARVNVGLSQRAAAKALKVGESTVANWESGKTSPRADMMAAICELYKCSPENLIFLPRYCG